MNDWKIEYKTVIINNKNATSFGLLPGVRGVCSYGKRVITVYRYEISQDLVLPMSDIGRIKAVINKSRNSEPEFLAHEKHHAQNNDAIGNYMNVVKNIYEYLALRCMDEASAYTANNMISMPKNKIGVVRAAIKGTEDLLNRTEFYFADYEKYLYSNIIFFNPDKPTHSMLQNNGMKIFEESYSDSFYAALSAYFTFDGYKLFEDASIRNLQEWACLRNNIQKIRSVCSGRASLISNEIKKRMQQY